MWTLVVLCSVLASYGVQSAGRDDRSRLTFTVPPVTTVGTTGITDRPSCRYACGHHMGSCSCSSSCRYYGNCCNDYAYYCSSITVTPYTTSPNRPSCRYACGHHMGSCSCSSSCRYYGNCCNDYAYYCSSTTVPSYTTSPNRPSCRRACGQNMGSCSCSSSCRYYGNCCNDYAYYCSSTTVPSYTTSPNRPSCRRACGQNMGSCSCSSSCRYYGNCCNDYAYYCSSTTVPSYTTSPDRPSCRYACGQNMGSCSCSSSCRYYGNCCNDYAYYCSSTTVTPYTTSPNRPSCRYACGQHMGSCSCSSSCRYYGNCCNDYAYYCSSTTVTPYTTSPNYPSCRYACGQHMGSCSCSSSCQYRGDCCYDYYSQCLSTTTRPVTPTAGNSCGGSLFDSGTLTSPNHPNYYHDNAYCVWYLRVAYNQRIFLQFKYLQLENCCSCDYISVYNGPSLGSQQLGKVCNGNLTSFYSSSNSMTVLFRTDGSVVGQGFKADFMSSLPPSSGRVHCSSDNMSIVIEKSYLNSIGYNGNSLYLNDPQCRPQFSRYQVVFSFPINGCGNIQKIDSGRIVYTNTLRAYTSNYGEITRQSHFKLNVGCRMDQDSVSQIMYIIHQPGNSSILGTGRFNTSMQFYTSSSFYYKVTQVPYEVSHNQNLYVQVDLRGERSMVLFLDTCVASPTSHDFQTRPYYLVRNGCPADNTYYAYVSGTRSFARFTFRAFQFLRATESVYIQCKVLICPASDYNSRCRRGCSRRTARELESGHDSQTLVLGPIQLKEPEKKEEGAAEQDKA